MAKRTLNKTLSRPAAIVDPCSISRNNGGRQVDWDNVPDSFRVGKYTVKINDAAANAGDTSIGVDALPVKLAIGTQLNFGNLPPVVVTVNGGGAIATATSIPVAALSGKIPNGTVLDFGAGAGMFAKLTAAAAAGATSLTVEALDAAIAAAKTATFPGGSLEAVLTAPAASGATSLTVDELPLTIPDDSIATFGAYGDKQIPAFTVMAQLASGMMIPRSVVTGGEVACGVIETHADENSDVDSLSGYGVIIGGVLFENLMPDADSSGDLPSAYKNELNTLGLGFAWFDYTDNRVVQ